MPQTWFKTTAVDGALVFDVADQQAKDHGALAIARVAGYPAKTTMTLDVDAVVDSIDMNYAVLAGFRVRGLNCGEVFFSASVNPTDLNYASNDPGVSKVGQLTTKQNIHIRLVTEAPPGQTGTTKLFIGGAEVFSKAYTFGKCNEAEAVFGAWYTSQGSGEALKVRYDNIVIRSQ